MAKSLSQLAESMGFTVKHVRYAARKAGAQAAERRGRTDYYEADQLALIRKAVKAVKPRS